MLLKKAVPTSAAGRAGLGDTDTASQRRRADYPGLRKEGRADLIVDLDDIIDGKPGELRVAPAGVG